MKIAIFTIIIITLSFNSIFGQENTSSFYLDVSWSPDGNYLTFTKMEMTNSRPPVIKADIYTMKADGTEIKKITGEPQIETMTSWSKDNRIFFGAALPNSMESNIFSVKPDGTGLNQITRTPNRSESPNVSRDGKKVVFTMTSAGSDPKARPKSQICTMNSDGSNVKVLTSETTLFFVNPVWSTDGKKIVYYVDKGDRKDQIWTMNADGSNQTLLTNNIGHNIYPFWSPDDKRIIFASTPESKKEEIYSIYSMKSDGSDVKRLMKTNGLFARYSPNGKKIAFIAGKFPETNIFVANADGSNEINLTEKR